MKHTFLLMVLTLFAQAADFSLAIGGTAAAIAPGDSGNVAIKKTLSKGGVMAVRPENCTDPTKVRITGTAEGIVDGMRRSVSLTLSTGTVPGAYIVNREWAQGVWVVNLTGICNGTKASAIVPFGPDGNYMRESSKFYPRAATGAEIEASLKSLAGGKK
jgi:hypothetical protein